MTQVTKKITEHLSKSGAKFTPYKQNPTELNFVLGSDRKGSKIQVYAEENIKDYDISTSKRHKQAVITIPEVGRTAFYVADINPLNKNDTDLNATEIRKIIRAHIDSLEKAQIISGLNIKGITNVKYHPTSSLNESNFITLYEMAKKRRFGAGFDPSTISLSVKVNYTTGSQTNSFLTGIDETAHFICLLPETAKNVMEAHEILRPKGVPKGTLRQGEFFFVPVSDKEMVNVLVSNDVEIDMQQFAEIEMYSSHTAENKVIHVSVEPPDSAEDDIVTYVSGKIKDKRKGRHDILDLGEVWHHVRRNTEIITRPSVAAKQQYWD